jgi:hypothetical protein
MLLIPASCGKKGDPFLPQKSTNIRVVDLKGAWQEGYIELKGGIPASSGPGSPVTGSRVYYAIYPVDEARDGCPIDQGFHASGRSGSGRSVLLQNPGCREGQYLLF